MYYVRAVKRVGTKRYFNVYTDDRHDRRIQSDNNVLECILPPLHFLR